MQEPGLPHNETGRVATLHSLNILDTPSDDRFDRYTRISARIFDAPIALISLVDRYRQWFKSAEGIDSKETPRSVSFCGHAILGDGVFEVPNARRDPRFRDNPLVINEPHIRFYAGAPLGAPNGHKLGTLCIADKVPRKLRDDEKVMLKNLADMVVGEMINFIDTETGLDNRNSLLLAGAKCFDKPQEERRFSMLLFDIEDVVAQHDSQSQVPAGEKFAKLLRTYFPNARSLAHLGGCDFCVLLEQDENFDESKAINDLANKAKATLCSDPDNEQFAALVGHLHYDPKKYISFDDMLREADELFFKHERLPLPGPVEFDGSKPAKIHWRKTIF